MKKSLVLIAVLFQQSMPFAAIGLQKFATQYSFSANEVPSAVRVVQSGKPWLGKERGPVEGLILFAEEPSGVVWLGGDQGAARFDPKAKPHWDRWQYFAGRRWLQDDSVQNIIVEKTASGRSIWIRTRTGVSHLEWRPMTLAGKARFFEERIEARHVRHGMISDAGLRVPGDLSSSFTHDNDNDGLWTSIYLVAESYRYAVTHEPEARARARRSVELLMRLEEITGNPGFPARSFVGTNEPRPQGGEWHATADGQWLWKGDTSSDEMVGHYFGYAAYFDLVADESEKARIRAVISRITDHLIRNGFQLIDLDGQPTRWGRWSESYHQTKEGHYESVLGSLELLSFLKTAYHITGDPRYQATYLERVERGYAEKMRWYRRWPGGGEINFSDDELAYLSYDPLLRYETDRRLRRIYLDGLRHTWKQVQPTFNPLWNYISAASGAGNLSRRLRDESRRTLERIPMDLINWSVHNSQRTDVVLDKHRDRFDQIQVTRVLAPDELPAQKWNSNPYCPDGGGNGGSEDDGAYFLLPYWMGRFHQWIEPD